LGFQARLALRLRFGDSLALTELVHLSSRQHRMNLSYANWVRHAR
jgi:hypothetical protein